MPAKRMARGIRINVDGSVEFVHHDIKTDRINDLIGGGYLEGMYFGPMAAPDSAVGFLDEDGKRKNLPLNKVATDFASKEMKLRMGDYIAGPIVLFGSDEEGDVADVPNRFITALGLKDETGPDKAKS